MRTIEFTTTVTLLLSSCWAIWWKRHGGLERALAAEDLHRAASLKKEENRAHAVLWITTGYILRWLVTRS